LYAYVSRGQVRSVPGEQGRPRLYAFADLERLRVRRDARAGHGAVAAGALRWGEPVLDSAITAITARGPAYRGKLAVDLAGATPFENVAELLWAGYLPDRRVDWPRGAIPHAQLARLVGTDPRTPLDVMPLLIQIAALADRERDDLRPDALIGCGRRLIPLLAAALAPGFVAAAVTRAGVAADAQPLEIGERVQPRPAVLAGDAADLAAADVRIERAPRDPEMRGGGRGVDPTLIVDSTLINHIPDATSRIRRGPWQTRQTQDSKA